jgi:symplekin
MIWVQKLVTAYEPMIDSRDRTFSHFLLNIPLVPQGVLTMLRDLCLEPDRRQVGFTSLRDFVSQKVPLRRQAMRMLLELTTHSGMSHSFQTSALLKL